MPAGVGDRGGGVVVVTGRLPGRPEVGGVPGGCGGRGIIICVE